jgi:hypothetical protein
VCNALLGDTIYTDYRILSGIFLLIIAFIFYLLQKDNLNIGDTILFGILFLIIYQFVNSFGKPNAPLLFKIFMYIYMPIILLFNFFNKSISFGTNYLLNTYSNNLNVSSQNILFLLFNIGIIALWFFVYGMTRINFSKSINILSSVIFIIFSMIIPLIYLLLNRKYK